jgi:hypothetical protein
MRALIASTPSHHTGTTVNIQNTPAAAASLSRIAQSHAQWWNMMIRGAGNNHASNTAAVLPKQPLVQFFWLQFFWLNGV